VACVPGVLADLVQFSLASLRKFQETQRRPKELSAGGPRTFAHIFGLPDFSSSSLRSLELPPGSWRDMDKQFAMVS
jgi:hypothetical protein